MNSSSHSDGALGDREARTEPYMKYGEGALERTTPRSAEKGRGVSRSAGKQAGLVRGARPFAVFDIDGTLIRWQLYHAVADELAHRGHFDMTEYQRVRQARMNWKKRTNEDSFQDYETAMIELIDHTIRNLGQDDFEQAYQTVLEEYKDQVYTYTRDLIQKLKNKNYLLFAISASQIEIVRRLAQYYGFDDWGGSQYEIKNGYFTGKKEVLRSERKPAHLKELVAKHDATFEGSIGIGDSESDIPMLELVEHAIAFNPSKKLCQDAQEQGWKIIVERKNMIYKLEPQQGRYILKP